jgi:hypothetical protein
MLDFLLVLIIPEGYFIIRFGRSSFHFFKGHLLRLKEIFIKISVIHFTFLSSYSKKIESFEFHFENLRFYYFGPFLKLNFGFSPKITSRPSFKLNPKLVCNPP